MASICRGNAVIGQSGGPTAVINQSLVGVIESIGSMMTPIRRLFLVNFCASRCFVDRAATISKMHVESLIQRSYRVHRLQAGTPVVAAYGSIWYKPFADQDYANCGVNWAGRQVVWGREPNGVREWARLSGVK